jgi:ankyrin repeat protein
MTSKKHWAGKALLLAAILIAFGCAATPKNEQKTIQTLVLEGSYDEAMNRLKMSDDINAADENGMTVLHAASQVNNTFIISYLLSRSADVSLKNAQSETALHTAIRFNSLGAASLLASEGGVIFSHDANGKTPIDLALENGGYVFFPALFNQKTARLQDPLGKSVVHHVVAAKNTAALAYCIGNNLPLSIPDNFGKTPLHLAFSDTHEAVNVYMAASLILGGASPVRGE